jgi:hypothetical protein
MLFIVSKEFGFHLASHVVIKQTYPLCSTTGCSSAGSESRALKMERREMLEREQIAV